MDRFIKFSVVAALCLTGVVAVPGGSAHATSLGDKFTNLHHPEVVVPAATYTITGTLVDSGGHAVSGGTVYLGSKSPAKTCDPTECESSAYSTTTKANGSFSFAAGYTQFDIAYVLYPPDDGGLPDLPGAVNFAVHTHNVYRWSGATSARVGTLLTTTLALGVKKTKLNSAAGAPTPLTQVKRGHGRWRTASRGSKNGLFDGFASFGYTAPPILAASKPGHYQVRVVDHGAAYQDAAHSSTVSLTVNKRHLPAWLKRTNHYRHSLGLQPFFENKKFDKFDRLHAKWMNRNGELCHCEEPGSPGYTKKGDKAGMNSVIELGVGNQVGAVDLWMGAPFHTTCLINPDVSIGGFGLHGAAAAEWCLPSRHVFDLATAHGNLLPKRTKPFTFPSHKMKVPTSLLTNRGENPDPRQSCPGHWDSWSVPVLFRLPQKIKGDPKLTDFKTSLTSKGHRVGPECSFSGHTFHGASYDKYLIGLILAEGPWVVLLVRPSLHRGATYTATFKDHHYKQSTTFTVAH